MPRIFPVLLFIIVEIVLLPVSLLGAVWHWVGLVRATRIRGLSGTAYDALIGRWLMHETGSRTDLAGQKMMRSLPAVSPLTMQMMMGPTVLAIRLTGVRPPMVRYPATRPSRMTTLVNHRTEFFDSAIQDKLSEFDQLVILGAGWDTRAYTLPEGAAPRVFEVDTAEMQGVKRAALERADIGAEHVSFVAADLDGDSWLDSLVRIGFDPDRTTFFLWEGVVYYLREESVHTTLAIVGSRLAPGSAIAFDYPSLELVHGSGPLPFRFALFYLWAKGERWRFGISTDPPARGRLEELVSTHGLELERYEPYGLEGPAEKPFGGMALAVKR